MLVLLVTKSFANGLDSNGRATSEALSHLLAKASPGLSTIKVLTAVVDKLSTISPHIAPCEGISIISSTASSLVADAGMSGNWSTSSSRFTHSLEPERPATLTLALQSNREYLVKRLRRKLSEANIQRAQRALRSYSIQIPLPSTLFSNGKHHTLMVSTFDRSAGSDSWTLKDAYDVQNARALLPFGNCSSSWDEPVMHMPLVRLTNVQDVENSMGNIVREVRDVTSPDVIAPASSALEKAVAQYFQATTVAPFAMPVWALVVSGEGNDTQVLEALFEPLSLESTSEKWQEKLSQSDLWWQDSVDKLMNGGVRIHRVTSGGGEWGSKAGLLALHPETSYNPLPSTVPDDLPDVGMDQNFGLPPVAAPGDRIQFYCMQSDASHISHYSHETPDDPDKAAVVFGVIPSTIDDESPTRAEPSERGADDQPLVLRNHLGVLSEQGIALKIEQIPYAEVVPALTYETKVDVPHAFLKRVYKLARRPKEMPDAKVSDQRFRLRKVPSGGRPAASSESETTAERTEQTVKIRKYPTTGQSRAQRQGRGMGDDVFSSVAGPSSAPRSFRVRFQYQ